MSLRVQAALGPAPKTCPHARASAGSSGPTCDCCASAGSSGLDLRLPRQRRLLGPRPAAAAPAAESAARVRRSPPRCLPATAKAASPSRPADGTPPPRVSTAACETSGGSAASRASASDCRSRAIESRKTRFSSSDRSSREAGRTALARAQRALRALAKRSLGVLLQQTSQDREHIGSDVRTALLKIGNARLASLRQTRERFRSTDRAHAR
jgi:hypothetical protein